MHRARFFDYKVRSLQRDTQGAPDNQAWETEDPANEWAAGRSSELSPWARRVFLGRGRGGRGSGGVRGGADRQAVTLQPRQVRGAARLPGLERACGRARSVHHCLQRRLNGSVGARAPTVLLATQATPARVSSSAGRRPSMRRSEGEAKCGHKACAV